MSPDDVDLGLRCEHTDLHATCCGHCKGIDDADYSTEG